jgi:hypothetical protein
MTATTRRTFSPVATADEWAVVDSRGGLLLMRVT